VEWKDRELVTLLSQKRGGKRGRARAAAAVVRWRMAEPRGGMACAREDEGGEASAVLGLGATRGGEGSRTWRRGGSGATVSGRLQRSRGQSRGAEGRQRKKKREGGPRGLFRIFKNLRDLTAN
jgi:hypothetical protein